MLKLCQLDFASHNPEATLKFMNIILGWNEVPIAIQDQAIIEVEENASFGISVRRVKPSQTLQAAPSLLASFRVDRPLEVIRAEAEALGALLIEAPRVYPGYGRHMVLEDQGGVRYGFYEADAFGPR